MSEDRIKTLGTDQMKWLNKYNEINLNHWRMISINKADWFYVGEYSSNCEDEYIKRYNNLLINRYYYWP